MQTDFHPHPDVVMRPVGTGAVLVHLPSNHVFELNETGRRIWEGLGAGDGIETIAAGLAGDFEISAEAARVAVIELCSQLSGLGLLA